MLHVNPQSYYADAIIEQLRTLRRRHWRLACTAYLSTALFVANTLVDEHRALVQARAALVDFAMATILGTPR